MNIDLSISDIRDLTQTAFFVSTGIIAILTYRQAKKTVLQPIKTEIFKEQIKEMSIVLEAFNGKTEYELRNDFDLDNILYYNVLIMFDEYASLFFDVKIDRDERPYSKCKGGLVTQASMEKYFEKADDHVAREVAASNEDGENRPDPRTKFAVWSNYEHYILKISPEFSDIDKKMDTLISNPLLPTELMNLLKSLKVRVHENLDLIREHCETSAKEMPEKYPNLNTMKKASIDWIRARYTKDFKELDDIADEITKYIKNYFKTDELIPKKKKYNVRTKLKFWKRKNRKKMV